MMKVTGILKSLIPAFAIFLLAACGGPNHKDPQSVAEAALKCCANGDTKGLIALLDPNNKTKQEEYKQFFDMLEEWKKDGFGKQASKEDRAEYENYTFKKTTGKYGHPIYDDTTEIEVHFTNKNGPNIMVPLELVDGKWYLNGIPR